MPALGRSALWRCLSYPPPLRCGPPGGQERRENAAHRHDAHRPEEPGGRAVPPRSGARPGDDARRRRTLLERPTALPSTRVSLAVRPSGHLHPGHGGMIHVVVPVLIVIRRPHLARVFLERVHVDHPPEYMGIELPAGGLAVLLGRDGAEQPEFRARPEVGGFL